MTLGNSERGEPFHVIDQGNVCCHHCRQHHGWVVLCLHCFNLSILYPSRVVARSCAWIVEIDVMLRHSTGVCQVDVISASLVVFVSYILLCTESSWTWKTMHRTSSSCPFGRSPPIHRSQHRISYNSTAELTLSDHLDLKLSGLTSWGLTKDCVLSQAVTFLSCILLDLIWEKSSTIRSLKLQFVSSTICCSMTRSWHRRIVCYS